MPTYVALLRGINVGGARKLPMADLSALLARVGLEDVVTYIASGNVVFLDRKPAKAAVARLNPDRSPPDELSLHGAEVYLRYPNGSGRTKLTLDYFERTLGVRATARNWNTVLKLLELSGS